MDWDVVSTKPLPHKPAQLTEAEARQKAKAAGKDQDWYVEALRKRKLLHQD